PMAGLSRLIQDYHLAAVLNLRGGSPSDSWYADEVRVTGESAVNFYDLPLSAIRRPTRRELLLLIDTFECAPYPLLIHCKSGSDRTGLASALYRLVRLGEPPERALDSFAYSHGHFPVGGPEHLHEPLLEYESWLRAQKLEHTPARFR